jgi:hypothetical protein
VIDEFHAARLMQIVRANRRDGEVHGPAPRPAETSLVSADRLEETSSEAFAVLEGWLAARGVPCEPVVPGMGRRFAARARRPWHTARLLLLHGRPGPVLAVLPAGERIDVRAALAAAPAGPAGRFTRRRRAQLVLDPRMLEHERVVCHSELRDESLVLPTAPLPTAGAIVADITRGRDAQH